MVTIDLVEILLVLAMLLLCTIPMMILSSCFVSVPRPIHTLARPLIEANVSRCFDEMVAIVFCGSQPWRSDYERARRRALAIAKPTSEGYWPRRSMINLTTRVCFLRANEEQARNWDCNRDIANIRWKLYWPRWGSVTSWSGRWTQTKYTKLQWLTFN